MFRGVDGRLYERVAPRYEENVANGQTYTPPLSRPLLYSNQGRRSASPLAERPQFHQRTPSINDNGVVVPSIEPPDSAYKSPAKQHNGYNIQARPAEQRDHLIDLTYTAERAERPARVSPSPPPSPYLYRTQRPAQSHNDRAPPPRQLIDLSQNGSLAAPIPTRHSQHLRHQDEYKPVVNHQSHLGRPHQGYVYASDGSNPRGSAAVPQRRVIYEAVDERPQHVIEPRRYVAEPTRSQLDARYYLVDDLPHQTIPLPATSSYADGMTRHRIVLEAEGRMEDVQYSTDPRYPTGHRPTYVRQ